jgi:hypothetical protein
MKTQEITRIALFSAIGFVFYFFTARILDPALPLIGCLIRPIIFLSFISSQFHLSKRSMVYISLLSTTLYALVVPCFVNGASIPVGLVYILVLNVSRSKLNSFFSIIASTSTAFIMLALIALLFSKKSSDFTNILKSFPYVFGTAIIVGAIRYKFGKVNCVGCDFCDQNANISFSNQINFKDKQKKGELR